MMASPMPHEIDTSRILIVDDHPIVRQGYSQLIGNHSDLEVCGFAPTEDEAMRQIAATDPTLVVVDIKLQDGNGIELIKKIRLQYPDIRMLVISAHDENLFAERALESGAMGYINKQEATGRLIDGIRRVLADEVYLSDQMTKRLLRRRVGGPAGTEPSRLGDLTDRELEVFGLIGHGQSVKSIALQLNLSSKTIERYRENIKNKLGIANATELVQRATQWVLEDV